MKSPPIRLSIVGLATVASVGPLGVHLLLPALPAIREHFGVSSGEVQMLVSLSLVALAVGSLVNGALSDRLGRRPVLLGGLALYAAGGLVAWFSQDFLGLLAGRMVQALGGGAAVTVVRALVRDLHEPDAAASMLAYMASFVLVVPMVVPLLAGASVEYFGWRSNFLISIAVGLAVSVFVLLRFPRVRSRPSDSAATPVSDVFGLLGNRAFLGFALTHSFSLAAFQAFLAGAPLLLIGRAGVSATTYGAWYMVVAMASMTGFFLAGRLSRGAGIRRMIHAGLILSVTATLGLLCIQLVSGAVSPPVIMLPAMGHMFANAIMGPSATSGAISERPDQAGAAAGLLGFMQFLCAAAAAQLTGILLDYTDLGVALVMAGASLSAATAYLCLVPRNAPVQQAHRRAE